jgi:transposase
MSNFRPVDRDTGFLMPPSVDEWLPERHLARFVVEVIEGLDLRAMTGDYRGSGEASYHPSVLLGLLVYGYATSVFSSRKLERATYDSVAFRFIAANQHPDHDTIATFRRRFFKQIEALFVQVLVMGREMGMLKLGTVALDGTKIHANASRPNRVKPGGMHSALSYERAGQIEMQLREEVSKLTAMAEAADQADLPDGMSIPEELARRDKRLAEIARARAIIEARAKERYAREQAEHAAKMAARAAKSTETGKKSVGRPPAPPVETPGPADQVNLPDEASRIMPIAGGGFEQCYNAQAVVAADSLLVVAGDPRLRRDMRCAGAQRQAAGAADAVAAYRTAPRTWQSRNFAGGYWIFQRDKRQCVRCRGDRSADRAGPAEPLPAACRAHRRRSVWAGKSDAGRGDGSSPADQSW